jgi:hypothetical protein
LESHWSLRRFYLYLNRKWFDGELPLDTILTWEPCDANTWAECHYLGDNRFHIKIDPGLRGIQEFYLQVLIHEMVHIEVALATGRWNTDCKRLHGKHSRWQARMHELAAAGAFDDLW